MSRRPKIKSKVVSETLANADVLEMFHGVLGTSEGAATTSVTHPKYLRMKTHTERFLKVLAVLHESSLLRELFPSARDELGRYLEALRAQYESAFCAPDFCYWLGEPTAGGFAEATGTAPYAAEDYNKLPPEVIEKFTSVFSSVKKCSLVNTVIVTCKNLVAHKKSLEDAKKLKDRFLTKMAGSLFYPLPDLGLNFKQLYIDDRLGPSDRDFVLAVLHKLYAVGHDLYEAVTAPDIDVNDFVEVIMGSVSKVRGQIPRCDEAFDKIVESVDLLKGNFGGYYKDYAASGNSSIIMENFVLDVSKNTKATPRVTAQFRKIISHYRKVSASQPSNPKLKSLFNQVDANFAELEKKSKAADEAHVSEESSSSETEALTKDTSEAALKDDLTEMVDTFQGSSAVLDALAAHGGQVGVVMGFYLSGADDGGGLVEELDTDVETCTAVALTEGGGE
jgi:hypothetical protein